MRILEGTVVIVTGGGSGIGAALVRACLDRGSTVLALDKNADRLLDLNTAAGNTNLVTEVVDVTDLLAMRTIAQKMTRRLGRVDVLINNAGVAAAGSFSLSDPEDLHWVIDTNFWGMVHGCYAFLPALRESHGRIANILSTFALVGFPAKTAYCASKFAARGFSESLRIDLAPQGIGVTTVFVGPADTNLIRDARVWDPSSQEREVGFIAEHGLSVDVVARRILHGVERERSRVFVGGFARMADFVARLAPSWVNSGLARWQHRIPFLRA